MSNYIKVSVPRMKSDSDQLNGTIEKIPKFISELEASMKRLGTCWEGPAWVSFQQQVESDIICMLEVYDWLHDYLNAMAEAEKKYGESERRMYNCIERVRI